MTVNSTPRVAFIGAGSIAQSHLEAVRLAGGEVVGVCTRSEAGQAFAQAHGIATFAQRPDALVEACQPDAVFLLTQPESYYAVLSALKPYNRPVLIEKPLGNRVVDAEALRTVLPDTVFVGLNRRFYSNIAPLLPLLADAPPAMAYVVMPEREKDYGQYADAGIRNHWDMLQGIHLVDLATHLLGPCQTVLHACQWGDLPQTTTPQYTMALYETTRQHRVAFLSNFDSPGGWRVHVLLPKQEMIISPVEKTVIRSLSGWDELPISAFDQQAKPGFVAQAACFLEGVRQPATAPKPAGWVSFEDALASMRTLEQVFQLTPQPARTR